MKQVEFRVQALVQDDAEALRIRILLHAVLCGGQPETHAGYCLIAWSNNGCFDVEGEDLDESLELIPTLNGDAAEERYRALEQQLLR